MSEFHTGSILPRIKAWVKAYPIALLTIIIMLGYLVTYLRSTDPPWIDLSVQAARQLVHGEDVYDLKYGFAYPPARALLAIPVLTLPNWAQLVVFWAGSSLCLVLMCRWMWQLAGGSRLQPIGTFTVEHALWLAGIVTGIFYVFNGLSNQSTDLFDGLIMVAGCLALSRRRMMLAATLLGVAAGLKATPLLWCAYLLWKREWRATLWLGCVAAGINFVPDLIAKCPTSSTWMGGWIGTYLAQFRNPDYMPGTWFSHIYLNQSLAGMINRMFLFDWQWHDGAIKVVQRATTTPPIVFKIAWLLIQIGILAASAVFCWRSKKGNDESANNHSSSNALEYSMVMLMMVLMSPMSSKSHFGILILPGMVLARVAWTQQSKVLWMLFIAGNVIGITALTWWGNYIAYVSLFYGVVTIKSLFLLAGCGTALIMMRQSQQASTYSMQPSSLPVAA